MTNDPWSPGPGYPPQMPPPPHGYPGYGGQFGGPAPAGPPPPYGLPTPPEPPGLAVTVIITLLAGVFGVIPASLHAARAQQMGYPGGRYWKAFGITLGALLAGQVLVVAAMVAAGLVALGPLTGAGVASGTSGSWAPGGASTGSSTPVVRPPATTGPSVPPTTQVPERTGRQEPTRTPTSVTVVKGSGGDACTSSGGGSAWGGYPAATCRTWKASSGLRTGATLSPQTLSITCQADLQEENPVYTAGQRNTWWVWTQSRRSLHRPCPV